MTAVFLKNDNTFTVGSREGMQSSMHDQLPAGNYVLKAHPKIGLYFEIADPFVFDAKLYGDVEKRSARILRTFEDRPNCTGVLLSGEKGGGKTLLGRKVAADAQAKGVPTVIISTPFCGEEFNTFVQSLHQPMVFFFDEFEKVYADQEQQQALLTLLDGVFPTKKLFVITSNSRGSINEYMRNRPGRIFYSFEFKGVEAEFIREYCADNLADKGQAERLVQLASVFWRFNFDMLKAMVEEMNRYGETPDQVMEVLNAKPEFSNAETYGVEVFVRGERVPDDRVAITRWTGNPLRTFNFGQAIWDGVTLDGEGDRVYQQFTVRHDQLRSVANNSFVFVPSEGIRLVMRKPDVPEFDWMKLSKGDDI